MVAAEETWESEGLAKHLHDENSEFGGVNGLQVDIIRIKFKSIQKYL